MEPLFRSESMNLKEPVKPDAEASRGLFVRWELQMRDYFEDEKLAKEGKFSLWSRLARQASDLAITKIKALKQHKENEKKRDCRWLLDSLEKVTNKVESSVHPIKCVVECRRKLYTHRKKPDQSLIDYADQLQSLAKTNRDVDPGGNDMSLKSSLHDVIGKMHVKTTCQMIHCPPQAMLFECVMSGLTIMCLE